MVETTITANDKTIENPIIRVTKSGNGNPSFVYFIDNQTVGQPRHWYVGDGNGNVVVSDVDVVDSTTSTALGTALTNQLTAAGYLSGSHTGTVNDVPSGYTRYIPRYWVPNYLCILKRGNDYRLGMVGEYFDTGDEVYVQPTLNGDAILAFEDPEDGFVVKCKITEQLCSGSPILQTGTLFSGVIGEPCTLAYNNCSTEEEEGHLTSEIEITCRELTEGSSRAIDSLITQIDWVNASFNNQDVIEV